MSSGAGSCQGVLPSDVRYRGTYRGSADAAARLIFVCSSLLSVSVCVSAGELRVLEPAVSVITTNSVATAQKTDVNQLFFALCLFSSPSEW